MSSVSFVIPADMSRACVLPWPNMVAYRRYDPGIVFFKSATSEDAHS